MKVLDYPYQFVKHPIRLCSSMCPLDAGISEELLSDRLDASIAVVDKYYEQVREVWKLRPILEEPEQNPPVSSVG